MRNGVVAKKANETEQRDDRMIYASVSDLFDMARHYSVFR